MDCVFCKIVAGEIPSKRLYEDSKIYAFYDIAPAAPLHFVVIPKKHSMTSAADINEKNQSVIGHIYTVIAMLVKQLNFTDYRVVTNVGEDAGQTVHHLHFHVLAGKTLGEMA